MLLVSMEDANMHSDDESLINSHRSSPASLSSRLPYAQSRLFWGQKKGITLAEKVSRCPVLTDRILSSFPLQICCLDVLLALAGSYDDSCTRITSGREFTQEQS